MNPIQCLLNWFDPIPQRHRDLAPAFDLEIQSTLWDLVVPLSAMGGIVFLAVAVEDKLLYPEAFRPLLLLRACLVGTFLLMAAIGHWRRGRWPVYRLAYLGLATVAFIAGLMLLVSGDPTGPYWIFFFFLVILVGILPWPTTWVLRTNLTIVAIYLTMASWGGALGNPAVFFSTAFNLVSALLGFAVISRLLNNLRWENFLNRRQVQKLNDLLQEQLDTQVRLYQQLDKEKKRVDSLLNVVIPIGVALSAEKNFDRLLEKITVEAKSFCNADAGTLYLRTEDDQLEFVVVHNDSLNIAMGGTSGREVSLPPLPLYDEVTGEPNHHNVATHATLHGVSINIPDAYQAEGFDFSGTKAFDAQIGYRSASFLTVPLKNGRGRVIGVLQLINAQDPETGQVIPFDESLQQIVESMSLLATVVLEAYIRELSLRQKIQRLRIELDEAKRDRQVAAITETEYFQHLLAKVKDLRKKGG